MADVVEASEARTGRRDEPGFRRHRCRQLRLRRLRPRGLAEPAGRKRVGLHPAARLRPLGTHHHEDGNHRRGFIRVTIGCFRFRLCIRVADYFWRVRDGRGQATRFESRRAEQI